LLWLRILLADALFLRPREFRRRQSIRASFALSSNAALTSAIFSGAVPSKTMNIARDSHGHVTAAHEIRQAPSPNAKSREPRSLHAVDDLRATLSGL
jgi:hypothetical protein